MRDSFCLCSDVHLYLRLSINETNKKLLYSQCVIRFAYVWMSTCTCACTCRTITLPKHSSSCANKVRSQTDPIIALQLMSEHLFCDIFRFLLGSFSGDMYPESQDFVTLEFLVGALGPTLAPLGLSLDPVWNRSGPDGDPNSCPGNQTQKGTHPAGPFEAPSRSE